ncbi:MAG: LPXTG cell wall anchor domain-containing protein [Agathobacter sp.]|nr:LPXTG cell wall anchor domain-containing protein [Agathobacter sp.]
MQTGDDFPIAFWMGLMIISFISIIILGRRSLKSDNN